MPSRQHFIKWFILSGRTLSFCLIYKYKCIHMRIYLCIARYYICMVTPTRSTPRYYYICIQLPWPEGHTITPTPGTSKQAIINSVSISWNLQNLGIQTNLHVYTLATILSWVQELHPIKLLIIDPTPYPLRWPKSTPYTRNLGELPTAA